MQNVSSATADQTSRATTHFSNMAQDEAQTVLASIERQRSVAPLSILHLAEPILANRQPEQQNGSKDASTVTQSEVSEHDPHLIPAALSADLAHYQSLFSKLRFSYLEQVTKEKYLRSIVGDPPVLVSHEENIALEEKLVDMKSELKSKKEEVAKLVEEIELLAKEVASKYETVNQGVHELQELPPLILQMESAVAEIKDTLREKEEAMNLDTSDDPRMNMSMEETEALIEEQQRKAKEVDEQIAALQRDLPGKIRECERAERELEELEVRRNEVTRLARDVKRIKEEGGRDALEEQGRWYKGSEIVLKGLLGVEA